MKRTGTTLLLCFVAMLILLNSMSEKVIQSYAYRVFVPLTNDANQHPQTLVASSDRLVGPPTITSATINHVLAFYHSPAQGTGQALYDLGVSFHIDPVFALAFFLHESRFGTQGEARQSLSLGNLRCIAAFPCSGGYAWFPSWEAGFKAWYTLMSGPLYVGAGLVTVEQIIPRYAPTADHNDEQAYINAVKTAVRIWRNGGTHI